MTSKIEQGLRLRAWRNHAAKLSGRKLTLEAAAELIAAEVEHQGHHRDVRWAPCTHASLTRWELGNVQQNLEGLGVIAKAYGVRPIDLMRMPP
jgi:hypothetical protein